LALEKALGQCGGSTSALREITAGLTHADDALRSRALGGDAIAARLLETVSAPVRRWGSMPGGAGAAVWSGARACAASPRRTAQATRVTARACAPSSRAGGYGL